MKRYMKNVDMFKLYLTQLNKPHYIREYVNSLNESELNWFYNQMREPLEFLKEESYLFYKLQWINKYEFDDLSKEIFLQSIFNAEGNENSVIKESWLDILYERYEKDIYSIIEELSS